MRITRRRRLTRYLALIVTVGLALYGMGMALYAVPGTAAASSVRVQAQPAMAQVTTGPVTSVPVPTAPGAITVTLPPEPADNSWAIAIAAVLLSLAVAVVAIVAGARRAAARNWRPATGAALPPIAAEVTHASGAGGSTDGVQNPNIESGSANDSSP